MSDKDDSNSNMPRVSGREAWLVLRSQYKEIKDDVHELGIRVEAGQRVLADKMDAFNKRCGQSCLAAENARKVRVAEDILLSAKSSKQTWGILGALVMAAASILFGIWNLVKK